MAMPRRPEDPPVPPRQAVASAIQDLIAARLARGFVPAALLFAAGVARLVAPLPLGGPVNSGGLALSAGALLSAGAMLAHGQRVVQESFGRPHMPWMSVARWGSAVPVLYGLYVLAWWGLRGVARGGGLAGAALGIVFAVMGTWLLRSWMRVVEVERLARVMTLGLEQGGEEA
jgi:hypothetical protein